METCGRHEQLADEIAAFVAEQCPDVDFELTSPGAQGGPLFGAAR